jgi:hypothetical protein
VEINSTFYGRQRDAREDNAPDDEFDDVEEPDEVSHLA